MTTQQAEPLPEAPDNRWVVLGYVLGVRVAVTLQMQSVGALGPALLTDPDLALGYAGLGALIGAYMLPGIVVALPAGWLAARLGERRMVLAGLALSTVGGLALAAAPGFGTALVVARRSGCEQRDNQDESLWSRRLDDCRGATGRQAVFG
ncbi:MFS transporter [Roseicella aerolata]|uniref:Major facilitator superfamily (MFS) profile domain-containing protein n=1 Tax=Roseicella aerolata TaxID=2883479 RepID=A0A9X1LAV4_9PROT|nr:MFS transporter [Roseicella aerolata]MCB4825431.1 hypothetical protein [Roseicella aerolata]